MSNLRRIGVLGGMGPAATILLQQKLLAAVNAGDDSDHIPLIIDMNPQVPSRIEHLINGRGKDPAPVLAKMAKRLQNAGAAALIMPCNTAHAYAKAITGAVSVPLLNMVELAADLAATKLPSGAIVGMLASPAVHITGLFDHALKRRGLGTLWPANQPRLLHAIQLIKTGGRCPEACDILHNASLELARQGAALQLVACSEFSLIADSTSPDTPVIDTLDVLVAASRAFSFNASAPEHP